MAADTEPQGTAAFAAPVEREGVSQAQLDGGIALVVLPGGLVLVDQAGPFAGAPWLGRPVSGPIHCESERRRA
jgi:hypothetical protein